MNWSTGPTGPVIPKQRLIPCKRLSTDKRDVAQDVLPDKHEEFVENALSSIIEKMDNGIPSEVEINKYTEGTCDSLDTSDDLLDLPENTPKCESLNETADTQNWNTPL